MTGATISRLNSVTGPVCGLLGASPGVWLSGEAAGVMLFDGITGSGSFFTLDAPVFFFTVTIQLSFFTFLPSLYTALTFALPVLNALTFA